MKTTHTDRTNCYGKGMTALVYLLTIMALLIQSPAYGDFSVTAQGPGGKATQALGAAGGPFDLSIPLNKNAVNKITVTAVDSAGNTATKEISVTQVSLDQIVVSKVTTERLSVQQVKQLVSDGVIKLDNPDNYNVSKFDIILTIGNRPISVSVAVPVSKVVPETPIATVTAKGGGSDSGSAPNVPDAQIIVFENPISGGGGESLMSVPGVIIIEGRIKSLKEFYNVRLLLMNTSGIFTLKDVTASIEFPDGGLTKVLPADGINSFGNILPGDGGTPGQVEKQFTIRGDEIGIRHIKVNFGGSVVGPGIPDEKAIPFNGSAVTDVEVKGPPTFKVQVIHPDSVTTNVPYELKVDITNTADIPAMYASLALDVGADAQLVKCEAPVSGNDSPQCNPIIGSDVRNFGNILPGETVREVFTINPLRTGAVTSCVGASDQNITLQVLVGSIGCVVGQFPPAREVDDGIPTVTVVPTANLTGVSPLSPVTAFFSEVMDTSSITTGIDTTGTEGTFTVRNQDNSIVAGQLRFVTLGAGSDARTVVLWQAAPYDLAGNKEYTVVLKKDIRNLQGKGIANEWVSQFTTTAMGINDTTPPTINLSVYPPVNPNGVLPGQIIMIDAYASDQGSGVARVELRIKDLSVDGAVYTLIDQKTSFQGDLPPYVFALDSAKLVPGHSYQALVTAYDKMGNGRDATISLVLMTTATPPTITFSDLPTNVLQGVSVSLAPQVTGAAREVRYYLDGGTVPFKTVTLAPFQAVLGTLTLSIGQHTVRAMAIDSLNQAGEGTYAVIVTTNINMPTVSLPGVVNGAQLLAGAPVTVRADAQDPVGIKSVSLYLDGTPVGIGTQSVILPQSLLTLGAHIVSVQAMNNLDVSNSPTDTASSWGFTVVEKIQGPPPAAPVISTISYSENGQVTVTGASVPGARVDITNVNLGITVTTYANSNGLFSAVVPAEAGQGIRALAYDFNSSQQPSPSTVLAVVPARPTLQSIMASPSSMSFTTVNAYGDITVTGSYDSGSNATITGQSSFSSSNPSVASVNSAGRVVALSSGSATITVSSGGRQTQVSVTVSIVTLTTISATPVATTFIYLGETRQLVVTGNYSDGSKSQLGSGVTFSSGNVAVAGVTAGGLISAAGNGSTQITAYYPGVNPFPVTTIVNTALDTPPQVQIVSPASGATVQRGDLVSVTVRATDPVGGIARVIISVTGPGGLILTDTHQIAPTSLDTTTGFTFTVPDTVAIGAGLTVTAGAVDTGNNTAQTASISLNVMDTTLPVIAITAPAAQAPYNYGDTITLTVHATDRVGVSHIRYAATGAFSSSGAKDISPAANSVDASFTITVPFGAASPNLTITAYAGDAAGNEGSSAPVNVIITNADITPPVTNVTSVSNPGNSPSTTVIYQITDGLADLDHVELYLRRNGIGTFNRYTDADRGYGDGKYQPQSGNTGAITFDSTKMGGDGSYEFYSVGVDKAGNREPAPHDSGTGLVVADQTATFNAGTNWTIIASPVTAGEGDTTYDNQNIRVAGTTFTINGRHRFRNVELLNNGIVNHSPATDSTTSKLDLDLWTLTIDSTSRIDLVGRGYRGGRAGVNWDPGLTAGNTVGSQHAAGGSHGGLGSVYDAGGIPAPVYDDFINPRELGSGGGNYSTYGSGAGGGLFLLTAINVINDSAIRANGALSTGSASGNGGGGGINITTRTLSGTGTIEAKGGGSGVGAGGGGGRIAVNYLDLSTLNQTGINVDGGQGAYGPRAANGTIFLKQQTQGTGELVIDGLAGSTAWTTLAIPTGYTFDNITLRNSARVVTDSPVHVAGRLLLTGNSTLTHTQGSEAGLAIDAAIVQIDAGSAIDTIGRGYSGGGTGNWDPGLTLGGQAGSQNATGGSYGGKGGGYQGADSGLVYGDPRNPVSLGSGGANYSTYPSGAGGGRITIHASTALVVDGAIRSDGGLGSGSASGDGSGGSVLVRTSRLAGSGVISANGGGHYSAGVGGSGTSGGGGRVAIYCDYLDNAAPLGSLRNVSAFAGHDAYDTRAASAGTIYVKFNQGSEELFIDDNNTNATASMHTPLTPVGSGASGTVTANSLKTDGQMPLLPGGLAGLRLNPDISQNETFVVSGNSADTITVVTPNEHGTVFSIVAAAGRIYSGFYRFDNLTFRRGGNLLLGDRLEVTGVLTLAEHAQLSHYAATDSSTSGLYLTLGSLNIDSSSRIDVTGRGYRGGSQNVNWDPGKTAGNAVGSQHAAGGSHGGLGSSYDGSGVPNPLYDSLTNPTELGSGGGNYSTTGSGAGGGRVLITAGSISVDGSIVANGAESSGSASGSGSGGTVNITTGSISGSGAIRADGGGTGTGGGGGRIAIVHSGTYTLAPDQITTLGGQGAYGRRGGIGTIFIRDVTQSNGDLVIDGGNLAVDNDTTTIPGTLTFDSVVLRNNARATVDSGLTVTGQLLLTGTSTMTHSSGNEAGIAIEARDIRIDAGSSIDTTGRGYRGGRGAVSWDPGLTLGGQNGSLVQAGGSYGGKGGGYLTADSGLVYGDPRNPIQLGSGGANYATTASGSGGGRVLLHASNSLVVNGSIRADGGLCAGSASGNGSGGSVLIRSSSLAGSGTISANGGGGSGVSGGGGRIAIYYDTLDQTDTFNNQRSITAYAGRANYDTVTASAGTVYLKVNQGAEELFIDDNVVNGTAPGATPLPHIGSGAAAAVTSDSLTVDGNVPLLPAGLAGLRLNPDTTQQETFAIKGNTANTISVITPNENGVDFLSYAAAGRNYGGVHHYENMTFRRGGSLLLGDPLEIPGTLKVIENGLISHFGSTDTFTSGLYLTTGSMIIDSTGRIDVTGRGYRGGRITINYDPGLTTGNTPGSPGGAGGSHGGLGGHYSAGGAGIAAPVYDSETNPMDLGGGGGNWGGTVSGAGGGRVLITTGLLSFDGAIIADGAGSGGSVSGSGAGGTINITAATLNGQGTVSAEGGSPGVGGGGGRIAIRHGGLLGLAGISVSGGIGPYGAGANGTVYLEQR